MTDLDAAHGTIVTISIAYRLLLAGVHETWADCIATASGAVSNLDLARWAGLPIKEALRRETDRLVGPLLPLVAGDEMEAA